MNFNTIPELEKMVENPIAAMLLKYYATTQVESAEGSDLPKLSEIHYNGGKGVGISVNNIFMLRSIAAMQKCSSEEGDLSCKDICYPYEDIANSSSWTSLPEFKQWLEYGKGSYNQGVSGEDGLLFAFDSWLKEKSDLIELPNEEEVFYPGETGIYYHKIIGGEPRSEFMTLMYNLFRYDMRATLTELVHPKGVGSGTTSQISEMAFGSLLAGPTTSIQTYRLRSTKISHTLNIGHFMMYEMGLTGKLAESMEKEGFDFTKIYNPTQKIVDLTEEWRDCFERVRSKSETLYRSPKDLFDFKRILVYAEQPEDEKIIRCNLKINNPENDVNVTDFLKSI
jgi:hypothetical protein